MKTSWPWTEQDLQDFETLVNYVNAQDVIRAPEPPPNRLIGLLGLSITPAYPATTFQGNAWIAPIVKIIGNPDALGKSTEERYRNYLARIADNSYCKWLLADARFESAYKLFLKKQQSGKKPGYQKEWAELRFLEVSSYIGVFARARIEGYRPRNPTSRQVKQAIKRVSALMDSLAAGVRFESWDDKERLKQLLEKLLSKLRSDQIKGYRKPHSDAHSIGREFVAVVSLRLLREFDEVSPDIVTNLARVMEYDADETAIERQIATARKKHRLALAAALRERQTNSA